MDSRQNDEEIVFKLRTNQEPTSVQPANPSGEEPNSDETDNVESPKKSTGTEVCLVLASRADKHKQNNDRWTLVNLDLLYHLKIVKLQEARITYPRFCSIL